jgi:hypothetical protein
MKTKANLVRNKLRAMGLKMSHEPEGELVEYAGGGGAAPQMPFPTKLRLLVVKLRVLLSQFLLVIRSKEMRFK